MTTEQETTIVKFLRYVGGLADYADEVTVAGMVDFAHKKALRAASKKAAELVKEVTPDSSGERGLQKEQGNMTVEQGMGTDTKKPGTVPIKPMSLHACENEGRICISVSDAVFGGKKGRVCFCSCHPWNQDPTKDSL